MTHLSIEQLDQQACHILETIHGRENELTVKERMAIPSQEMACLNPETRCAVTHEVALGYTENQAIAEANRCLRCKTAPCMQGCPVSLQIRDFITEIANRNYANALSIIKKDSMLPAICGRVCPQENQCQAHCTVGKSLKNIDQAVAIGRLERFVADWERRQTNTLIPEISHKTGKKIAIIGSGPAGLSAAADLFKLGHEVTVFEALHANGGVMTYGIPEFRLPKDIVRREVDNLKSMGVAFINNFIVGRTRKLMDLLNKDGFDAVFIGTGAGLPNFMNIPGEDLVGVFAANEYLTRANLMKAYNREKADTPILRANRVAILGGGNVAMDAARTARRLGAQEVHVIYRRSASEMPARHEEVIHAQEEGIQFHFLTNAKRILGDENDHVQGLECLRYELGEADASGRRSPIPVEGSEFVMPIDAVLISIGNSSNPLIRQTTPGLEYNRKGNIAIDDCCRTSLPGVYAGGDIVLGAATVILAMGQGRKAAKAIHEDLMA